MTPACTGPDSKPEWRRSKQNYGIVSMLVAYSPEATVIEILPALIILQLLRRRSPAGVSGRASLLFLFLFAIAGLQIFREAYHYACMTPDGVYEDNSNDAFGCGVGRTCPDGYRC